ASGRTGLGVTTGSGAWRAEAAADVGDGLGSEGPSGDSHIHAADAPKPSANAATATARPDAPALISGPSRRQQGRVYLARADPGRRREVRRDVLGPLARGDPRDRLGHHLVEARRVGGP